VEIQIKFFRALSVLHLFLLASCWIFTVFALTLKTMVRFKGFRPNVTEDFIETKNMQNQVMGIKGP
jgi:hypothetical protein